MAYVASDLQRGERVSILLDVDMVQALQEGLTWNPAMARCLNRIGTVAEVNYHTVDVEFGAGERWAFNPVILTRVKSYEVGDRVRVMNDERKVKELQRDHGGWVDAMITTIGKEGEVKRVFADGDLRIEVADSSWTFNPNALVLGGSPASISGPPPQPNIPVGVIFDAVADGDIEHLKSISKSNPRLLKEEMNGMNPLHVACQAGQDEIVSFLMGQGIDPNQPDICGKTPLMFCCEVMPNPMCVRHLIQAGARPNDCGKLNNKYPLLLAIEYNLNEICKELIDSQKCNVNIKDTSTQDTPLHVAARITNLNIVMNLLEAGADPFACNGAGLIPLHVAILEDSQKVVRYLLENIPNLLNAKADRGEYNGLTPVHLAILKDRKECLVLFLEQGLALDLEEREPHYQFTPFLYAVYCKKFHMLEMLMMSGSDVYAEDSLGNNALHILASIHSDNYDVRLIYNSPLLQKVYKDVELVYGAHIKIAMYCFLIKIRVPFDKSNKAGVYPLSDLSHDMKRYCIDSAPHTLPGCTLCDRIAEFMNSPCEHVTYCVVHAIDGSRCSICLADIRQYNTLVASATIRRQRHQAPNRRFSSRHPHLPPMETMIPDHRSLPGHIYEDPHRLLPPPPPAPAPAPAPAPPAPALVKEEGGAATDCGICYENYKTVGKVCIDPCGHTCCKECGPKLTECHICRQPILKTIPVFDC